jgi:hypothetical protein
MLGSVGKFVGTSSQVNFKVTYHLSPVAVNSVHSTLQTTYIKLTH